MNSGETRLFSSGAADYSGEKPGFLSRTNIKNLWLGTYMATCFHI
ncbi:Uncharacterized protein dnm_069550 [Desulfonema magnum]|uniref:Uncharacterized protein n=1 Tax=Desulfonema magnum TaxID=45655 RepID=A0A975BSP2_9BACT|nr:Uncharacterized protein dnm_069550 [Desulfonema magnum]